MKTRSLFPSTLAVALLSLASWPIVPAACAEEQADTAQQRTFGGFFERLRPAARPVAHREPAQPQEQPKPRARQNVTLENLLGRWDTGRSQTADEIDNPAHTRANVERPQLEKPIPASKEASSQSLEEDGDFPAFDPSEESIEPSSGQGPVIASPVTSAPPVKRTLKAKVAAPAKTAPTTKAADISSESIFEPEETPAPTRRSTYGFMADDARYGTTLRKVPAAPVESEPSPPVSEEPDQPKPLAVKSLRTSTVEFSLETAGQKPEVVGLRADDTSPLRTSLPMHSAEFFGPQGNEANESVLVSPAASPAALQQVLRKLRVPASQEQPAAKDPSPAKDETPRSTKSESRGTSSAKASQGFVRGVDEERGTLALEFPEGRTPAVGSRVKVYQRGFFQRELLGDFLVVGHRGEATVARPLGKARLDEIMPGDEALAL